MPDADLRNLIWGALTATGCVCFTFGFMWLLTLPIEGCR